MQQAAKLCAFALALIASCVPVQQASGGGARPGGAAIATDAPIQVGDRVSCDWKGGGTYYDGVVAEQLNNGRILINYDDGDVEATTPDMCRSLAPSGTPQVASGGESFAVGARVSCNWKSGGTFYDGRVAEQRAGGRILIHYDDGDIEETTPDKCRARTPVATGGGLSGNYAIVSAANPGGGASYTGTVSITRSGEVYRLDWRIGGSHAYSGVGLEINGWLAVGWGQGGAGVVAYRVSGGQLSGKWASTGSGPTPGVEDLSGPAGVGGTYQIVRAHNPQGGSYTGSVSISKNGDTHTLAWTLPRESYSGVGILRGDVLAVGWGGGGTGVVAYKINGNRLEGVWADPRGGALGSEVLERR